MRPPDSLLFAILLLKVHCCPGGHAQGRPFDDDGAQPTESYEAFETQESNEAQDVGGPAGRWYRRGNRIVLVGA